MAWKEPVLRKDLHWLLGEYAPADGIAIAWFSVAKRVMQRSGL